MSMRITIAGLVLIAGLSPLQAQDAAPAAGDGAAAVAAGDPAMGQTAARKCVACHSFEEGAKAKVGPNLWGIVGRPIAAAPDYKYSDAMTAYSEGGAKLWTVDELNGYLLDPRKHVPGTKMAFPGLKKDDERANVIAYLATLGPAPAQ